MTDKQAFASVSRPTREPKCFKIFPARLVFGRPVEYEGPRLFSEYPLGRHIFSWKTIPRQSCVPLHDKHIQAGEMLPFAVTVDQPKGVCKPILGNSCEPLHIRIAQDLLVMCSQRQQRPKQNRLFGLSHL